MTLNSFSFLVFFAGTLLLLWILKLLLQKNRHFPIILRVFLVIAGYLFIAYADIRYALCLFLFSLFTFFLGLLIRKYPEKKKPLMILGILVPLFFLGLFKYYNFFAGSFCRLIGRNYHSLGLLLPLGISFYTFSAIGYLIDLYRGKYSACTSFTEFLLYMGFFPKLISGPIMRFDDFKRELSGMLLLNPKDFEAGIQIFVIGMFKKMVLADHLNIFVNDVFSAPKAFHSLTVLWAVITYSIQIYFDFSGYSDMAIGSARMLGFHLPKNFNFPYLSSNLTEFWKRWHITLSSWLQEYVYYSLGGNRKGRVRTYLNLLLTMVIGGLWHGAAWTFLVWGALHGIGLILHKLHLKYGISKGSKAGRLFCMLFTFGYASLCWVFFRADSLNEAWLVLTQLFSCQTGILQPYTWTFFSLLLLTTCSIYYSIKKQTFAKNAKICYPVLPLNKVWGLTVFFLLCGLTIGLAYVGNTAFIYGAF